jgi:hypothetical protein
MRLSQINIYPVKSLDGFSPESAIVEKRGLQYDRRWLIVDENNVFITQRTSGRMALLKAEIAGDFLKIFEKKDPENNITLPLFGGVRGETTEGGYSEVQIWNDVVKAAATTPEADQFLSDFLEKKCRLVKMTDAFDRRVDEDYNTGEDIVSFADGYPFLIIGEASMRDLNERLDIPLSLRRFRANFIFSGGEPFIEDNFKYFKIGEVDFTGVKNCARCVLTTRDPDTGIKGKEPLQTLMAYRQKGTKTLFGQNVIWNHRKWEWAWQPEVRVGDELSIAL